MILSAFRSSGTALALAALFAALFAALLLPLWGAAPVQAQTSATDNSRRIAANEPGSALLAPARGDTAPGQPGAALAPKGGDATMDAHAPGAALAPKGGEALLAPDASAKAEEIEALIYEREPLTRVRIAIVNATGKPAGAAKVAVLLSDYRRRPLEDKMGLKIELVNLSTGYERTQAPAMVYYRPGFLRPALLLAQVVPGDTIVAAMRPAALKRAGVDVEVVVGEELP
jgi:hypothetical protein